MSNLLRLNLRIKLLMALVLICPFGFSQVNVTGKEDHISLPKDFQFQHPMTVTSKKEIAVVKDRIKNGMEPQKTAFRKLIYIADSFQRFIPDPPVSMEIISGKQNSSTRNTLDQRIWLWRNCSAAYTSALAFTYTGNQKYADKAVKILNAWVNKGTVFIGNGRYLQIGAWFSPMLYAADLLHDFEGWNQNDRAKFKKWWQDQCLVNTLEIMVNKKNNFKDAGILGVISAAMVFEDRELLEKALNELLLAYKKNPKDASKNESWKIAKDEKGVYLPLEAERELGRKGLVYSYLSMTTTVQSMEMARYAGYNFWTAKTPDGGTYQGVIEQLFKWSIQGEPFPWNPKPDNEKSVQVNSFEIANSNCRIPAAMKAWLKKNRPVLGAQGDEYVTLNKGDIFNY